MGADYEPVMRAHNSVNLSRAPKLFDPPLAALSLPGKGVGGGANQ